MKNINKYGLRLKPNFDELILSLEADRPYRALPSRLSTTLRNSHQLTQLDGDTLTDLNDMETSMQKDKLRNIVLKEQATQAGISIAEATAQNEANLIDLGASPLPSYSQWIFPSSRASSSSIPSLFEMTSPEYYRMDTPYQTRANTPRQSPFRTHEEEANAAEEMLRENSVAQLARQISNLNLVPEASPPSSSSVMTVLTRVGQSPDKVVRKLNFDNVEDSPEGTL